jgi:hypothetical protein
MKRIVPSESEISRLLADSDAMGVAAEIGQQLFGPAEGWLGVDNPVCVPEPIETTCEDFGIGEVRESAEEEAQIAFIEGVPQVS